MRKVTELRSGEWTKGKTGRCKPTWGYNATAETFNGPFFTLTYPCNKLQYFMDLEMAFINYGRVLRPGTYFFLFCRVSRNFHLFTRKFDIVSQKFDIVSRKFVLVSRNFDLLTRKFEILSRIFELMSKFRDTLQNKKDMYLALILFRNSLITDDIFFILSSNIDLNKPEKGM